MAEAVTRPPAAPHPPPAPAGARNDGDEVPTYVRDHQSNEMQRSFYANWRPQGTQSQQQQQLPHRQQHPPSADEEAPFIGERRSSTLGDETTPLTGNGGKGASGADGVFRRTNDVDGTPVYKRNMTDKEVFVVWGVVGVLLVNVFLTFVFSIVRGYRESRNFYMLGVNVLLFAMMLGFLVKWHVDGALALEKRPFLWFFGVCLLFQCISSNIIMWA